MIVLNFVCPLCDACFSKTYQHIQNKAVFAEKCPHCKSEIELTPEKVMEAASAHIINTAVARRI